MQTTLITRGCRPRFLALLLAALAGGCASGLSQEECRIADWRTIGYEDGVRGLAQSRISEHRSACAEHGIALDLDAYRAGWDEGVRMYCRPGNGYRLGRAGGRYTGVCPVELEAAFARAHAQGREIHDLEAEVRRLRRALDHKISRVAHLEVELRDAGIELVSADLTTEQRIVLLDEMRKLQQEHADTRAEVPAIEAELEHQRQHLEIAAAHNPY